MVDDSELLLRYCENQSESAFAELVSRHFNLVHFAALRRVNGDVHRAQDVAQEVFTRLAQKAPLLARRVSIAGWLYNTTRFIAARLMRSERRRQIRQVEAQTMMADNLEPEISTEWERLGPMIDESLQCLNARDRELILWRYFQENTFVEISSRLGFSADAARFRLQWALEKMRAQLRRRGIESTSAAIALALASQAQATVPAGAAVNIVGKILAAKPSVNTTFALFRFFMNTSKLKVLVLAVIAGALIGTLGMQNLRMESHLRDLTRELTKSEAECQRLEHAALVRANASQSAPGIGSHFSSSLAALAVRRALATGAPSGSRPSLKPGMKPIGYSSDVGQATPADTLETAFWAADAGDIVALAKMLTLQPAAREEAGRLWAELSPEDQAQFPTPESVVVLLLAKSTYSNLVAYQITDDQPRGSMPGIYWVDFQYQDPNGAIMTNKAGLQEVDGSWTLSVAAGDVQKLAARYLGK